jgi:hypothetical protein
MRDILILLTAEADAPEVRRRMFALEEITGDTSFRYFTQQECVFGVIKSQDLSEYEDEEISEIRSRIGEFAPLAIEYPDAECVRDLLLQLLPGVTGVLDTNYNDALLAYDEALRQIEANPDWSPRTATG